MSKYTCKTGDGRTAYVKADDEDEAEDIASDEVGSVENCGSAI